MPIDLTPYAPPLYLVSTPRNFSLDLDITLTLNERVNATFTHRKRIPRTSPPFANLLFHTRLAGRNAKSFKVDFLENEARYRKMLFLLLDLFTYYKWKRKSNFSRYRASFSRKSSSKLLTLRPVAYRKTYLSREACQRLFMPDPAAAYSRNDPSQS